MLNWLAAPFGSAEHYFRTFGEEGVDHTINGDGDPVKTKLGTANIALPTGYFADAPRTLYQPAGRRMSTCSTDTSPR